MQSRETRFWLRFETGARQGEEVPLAEGVATIGRRSDNRVVVVDGSVSGQHAELRIGVEGVTLSDLGSTNGTRVEGVRVETQKLSHGDRISLGAVQFTLIDRDLAPEVELEPVLPQVAAAAVPDGGEGVARVSADVLARSARRSRWGWVLMLVIVLGAGTAAVLRLLRTGASAGAVVRVQDVPGNLLEDYSFEDPELGVIWEAADGATRTFGRDRSFAQSGAVGLGVELEVGEWALARSPSFDLPARRLVALHAQLAVEDGALGRVGMELIDAEGVFPSTIAWTAAQSRTDGFAAIELAFDTIADYETGRVVVAALGREAGSVSVDDVDVLLSRETRGATASYNEFELFVLGDGGSTAVMLRSGRVGFTNISFAPWSDQGLDGWAESSWNAESTEDGMRLWSEGAPADARLSMTAFARDRSLDPDNEGESANQAPWIATVGPGGYHSHLGELEREDVSGLLLGRGLNLLRVGWKEPVRVRGAIRSATLHVSVEGGAVGAMDLQLSFQQERSAADLLASRGRDAEAERRFGESIAAWTELLNEYPFDARLIEEADASRGRVTQIGFERVDQLRAEVERAGFFGLADLHLQTRAAVQALAKDYAGTEVEVEALRLVGEIDAAMGGLDEGRTGSRSERLGGVLEALSPEKQPQLFEHVRSALESED